MSVFFLLLFLRFHLVFSLSLSLSLPILRIHTHSSHVMLLSTLCCACLVVHVGVALPVITIHGPFLGGEFNIRQPGINPNGVIAPG